MSNHSSIKNKSIMNKVKNNQVSGSSQSQSSRMRMILVKRWPYVWQEVETRFKNYGDLRLAQGEGWQER